MTVEAEDQNRDAVAAWEKLGAVGREELRSHLVFVATNDTAPYRYLSDVMIETDVSSMTCTAHPLERVASEHGCSATNCCNEQRSLATVRGLRSHFSRGNHAVALVRAFLDSPDLAFPPDIPSYALRCAAWVKKWSRITEKKIAARVRKQQRELEKAGRAAMRKKIAETKTALRKLHKASYAYRIARATAAANKVSIELVKLEKRMARLQKKKARAWRSVNALKVAAQKKGEQV